MQGEDHSLMGLAKGGSVWWGRRGLSAKPKGLDTSAPRGVRTPLASLTAPSGSVRAP